MRLAVVDIGSNSVQLQVVAGALGAAVTLNMPSAEICPWALREGILLRHLERVTTTPVLPLTRHPDATVRPLRAADHPVPI